MTAPEVARPGYAARGEMALRQGIEDLLRQRRPTARICHEMVMGAREVRADVVAIDTSHMVAVEVKGPSDNLSRLMHQVGMFQLCMPEVWVVTSKGHRGGAELMHWLLPSIGVVVARDLPHWDHGKEWVPDLEVIHEAVPRDPHPLMMSEMMWAQELANICNRARIATVKTAKPPRAKMIDWLTDKLTPAELLTECCTELRARHALWRADAPTQRADNEGDGS